MYTNHEEQDGATISGPVFAEILWTLRSVGLVVGHFLGPLYEVWMQKSCEVRCIFLQDFVLLLLHYSDSKEVDQPLLLYLPLFLFLGLPILFQFDLPKFLYLSLMFLLFHPFLLPCHLLQLLLLGQPLQHF